MRFNDHSQLNGLHAYLSASKYHWVNYDEEKLDRQYRRSMAAKHGERLHDFAAEAIRLGQHLPDTQQTLNMYVNDCIGYMMRPELVLYYSPNAFGTADAISFTDNKLRIHDLKTGVIPASINQLEIYAALFCLEYSVDPSTIEMELRIYQSNDILVHVPESDVIQYIMDKIKHFDIIISQINMEV